MQTYLVTGATGFVGGALTQKLLEQGHKVRAVVRPSAALSKTLEGVDVQVASLGDPNALAEVASGVDVLYHCAAENSARAPLSAYAWMNVAATENVINAARHAGVKRVVHLSCADATLVNRDRMSWRETQQMPEAPLDALSRSKLLAEDLALQANRDGLQVCVLRPAWVWGPGDRRTLPALCRESLERGRAQLCGNGDNIVPSVHVDNLVHALLLAATAEAAPGHVYHVLDGEVLTAREFIGQLCTSVGLPAPASGVYALSYALAYLRERFERPGLCRADVVRRGRSALFDGLAAARELGYEPQVNVQQGMTQLAAWAAELGGPTAIAKTERCPATATEVNALIALADQAH